MKKIHILIACFLFGLVGLTSCDPDEKFQSPDTTLQGSVPALFASMLNNPALRTEYWQVRTFYADHIGVYSQTLQSTKTNSYSAYKENDSYLGNFWKEYYVTKTGDGAGGTLSMYRLMEVTNDKDKADIQKTNEIFLYAGKVILYERTAQMIDMFGNIPFHTAISLPETSSNIPAKFEDQKQLYKEMIEDLKNVADYFKGNVGSNYFQAKDILLSGKTEMWCRYANSIRLRMLMRIVEAESAYAQPLIMEIVNNPTTYPLIDGDNNGNYSPASSDILLHPLTSYTETLNNALNEGYTFTAPDYMMNTVLLPVNDVRIPVLFDGSKNAGEYKAIPITASPEAYTELVKGAANWDSTTFWFSRELPGIRITATEVNLLRAEAFERWGSSAAAKTAYETAVKQSVTFYYYLNSINSSGKKATKPSDVLIDEFVTQRIAYTTDKDKNLEMIATQKWLHFGFMQCIEAWAEYRRTKMPQLAPFPTVDKESGYTAPPKRLMYPTRETNVNPNYEEVRSQDTRDTKIFWDVK